MFTHLFGVCLRNALKAGCTGQSLAKGFYNEYDFSWDWCLASGTLVFLLSFLAPMGAVAASVGQINLGNREPTSVALVPVPPLWQSTSCCGLQPYWNSKEMQRNKCHMSRVSASLTEIFKPAFLCMWQSFLTRPLILIFFHITNTNQELCKAQLFWMHVTSKNVSGISTTIC